MKRGIAVLMLTGSLVAQSSSIGTCRAEYSRWYPSESAAGEPEVVLARDIFEQNRNVYTVELHNRAKELMECSITANENPTGPNRVFDRLSGAYLQAVGMRYAEFLRMTPAESQTKTRRSLLDQFNELEKVTVGCASSPCRLPVLPYGPS